MHYLEQIMVRSVMNDPNNAASDIDDCYKLTGTALARLKSGFLAGDLPRRLAVREFRQL